jgi:hypothetical protein
MRMPPFAALAATVIAGFVLFFSCSKGDAARSKDCPASAGLTEESRDCTPAPRH